MSEEVYLKYPTLQVLSESDNCKCIPKRTKRGRERCVKPVCDPKGCDDNTRCVKRRRTSSSTAGATGTTFPELATSASPVIALVPTCKMTMYDQTYFRGKSVEITGNVSDFKTIKFDNLIASVKIEGNCCWTLFADKSFQGASVKLKIGKYQSATNIIDVFKKASSAKNYCWERKKILFCNSNKN